MGPGAHEEGFRHLGKFWAFGKLKSEPKEPEELECFGCFKNSHFIA